MSQSTAPPRASTPDLPPIPTTPVLVGRSFLYWLAQYRRTYRGTAISTILEPVGFLAAMGLGLGVLVDKHSGPTSLDGVTYLQFLAPGLLAASAMQMTSFESTYPVLGAIKWQKQYHAMLATPLRVVDVLAGHLLFVVMRLTITVSVFLIVMELFGAIASPLAILCIPVGILTGLAYSPAIFAFAATRENDSGFAMLFRFGIIPMFLFSGTFFPVSQLPGWLHPVAWVVPLWHGVDLSRDLALGGTSWAAAAVHVTYLLGWVVVGFAVALRTFERRLVT
jgi:lipooligosaccharide transport system permease protein